MNSSAVDNPIISVIMITYGHEKFIEQAINSVLMQECDFEVELVLANDCSPDQTDRVIQDILENHPRKSWIRYFKHEKNMGMMPNFIFAMKECQGKYIALCEGDDYWTDPLKLQKQFDFLDVNHEYNIVWTRCNTINENLEITLDNSFLKEELKEVNTDNFFIKYRTMTLTCMFRSGPLKDLSFRRFKFFKDNSLYFLLLKNSKGRVLEFTSAVYRMHQGGVWSSKNYYQRVYHDYNNLDEIINLIVDNINLRNFRKERLHNLVGHLSGYDNIKNVDMDFYKYFLFPIINYSDLEYKLRFIKWILIKKVNSCF